MAILTFAAAFSFAALDALASSASTAPPCRTTAAFFSARRVSLAVRRLLFERDADPFLSDRSESTAGGGANDSAASVTRSGLMTTASSGADCGARPDGDEALYSLG